MRTIRGSGDEQVFASEALQRSAYEALQIAAGSGYMRDAPYEQITAIAAF